MAVIIDKSTKIIIQGFTGKMGTFHADEMMKYGSNVVGGVTPGKGGTKHLDRPVFNTVKEAVKETGATASILFVPPAFAADSAMEAADAGIKTCVAIVDGIPSHDMIKIKRFYISTKYFKISRKMQKLMFNYGIVVYFNGLGRTIILMTDMIMLSAISGLKEVGICTTMVFFSNALYAPYTALMRISSPYVSKFWKSRDMKAVSYTHLTLPTKRIV